MTFNLNNFLACRVVTGVVILIQVFFVELSAQNNYYVSADIGNDDFNGLTETTPFKTINRGIAAVEPGGTVFVMNGVYQNSGYGTVDPSTNQNMNNPHVVTINKTGEPEAFITLTNLPNHHPKIKFDGRGGILIDENVDYIIIDGFEVEGPSANIDYDMAFADRVYKVQVSEDLNEDGTENTETRYNNSYFSGKGIWGGYDAHKYIIIKNNVVHDTPGSGIRFNDSDYITIENNTVYNTTWWTSSASSAIVYAETISQDNDNGTDIKMIMRGNVVYNNWNRIPFYTPQLPDNSGNENQEYASAAYNNIVDGQGLYVTRSDPNYNGTFLFENNVCVNNGKNGINFDNSLAASAIYRNNTLYYNGVHEYIQNLSVADGNPAHRGQNVAGIKANKVLNATVVNNIVVTRPIEDAPSYYTNGFAAMELNNVTGSRTVNNNIFYNGNLPSNSSGEIYPYIECCNIINPDSSIPIFMQVPSFVDGPIDINQTDFKLMSGSPAINSGDSNNAPASDINGNPRPINDAIFLTSFEAGIDGWTTFASSIELSSNEKKTGNNSLFISDRNFNYSSPRLFLNNILTPNESYTFHVNIKLADGVSGDAKMIIKNTIGATATYNNLTDEVEVNDQTWTQLSGNYTHTSTDQSFIYIRGPINPAGGKDFFIDDFSLVPLGDSPVDFTTIGESVDIGAYEYQSEGELNILDQNIAVHKVKLFPNPSDRIIYLTNCSDKTEITIADLSGKHYQIPINKSVNNKISIDISVLQNGVYFLTLLDRQNKNKQNLKFIKY